MKEFLYIIAGNELRKLAPYNKKQRAAIVALIILVALTLVSVCTMSFEAISVMVVMTAAAFAVANHLAPDFFEEDENDDNV